MLELIIQQLNQRMLEEITEIVKGKGLHLTDILPEIASLTNRYVHELLGRLIEITDEELRKDKAGRKEERLQVVILLTNCRRRGKRCVKRVGTGKNRDSDLKKPGGIRLQHARYDELHMKDLSERITELLDDSAPMEHLNHLFLHRFMVASYAALFLQGAASTLLYALSHRDSETAKLVVQLLMNENIPLE